MSMKFLLFSVLVLVAVHSTVGAKRRIMPWMCLERCNHTHSQILAELTQIHNNRDVIPAVAYEEFNLGKHCVLDRNDFTPVGGILKAFGFETYAMISSFPYPPEFLDWMRECFTHPEAFVHSAVQAAVEEGFTGYNVDFEPHTPATPADAINYAKFLDYFASELHKEGKKLTVAVATWNPIWDLGLIGKTGVDKIMTMSTYTTNYTTFERNMKSAVSLIPQAKLGIGMQVDTAVPVPEAEVIKRLQIMADAGVMEADLWQSPIPAHWLPHLRSFALGKFKASRGA